MRWRFLKSESKVGLELTFEDSGLGIPNVAKAMEAGYSTGNGLGMGLPGAKRLTDEMTVHSEVGKGTTVVVRKWLTK
jgi:serine/threonine-protein kinase RsbT